MKEDCLEAKKYKETEQVWLILARSRFFVEKYQECLDFLKPALEKYPACLNLQQLKQKATDELSKENFRIGEISTMNQLEKEKKYTVYRALRDRKIKLGEKLLYLPEIVEQ